MGWSLNYDHLHFISLCGRNWLIEFKLSTPRQRRSIGNKRKCTVISIWRSVALRKWHWSSMSRDIQSWSSIKIKNCAASIFINDIRFHLGWFFIELSYMLGPGYCGKPLCLLSMFIVHLLVWSDGLPTFRPEICILYCCQIDRPFSHTLPSKVKDKLKYNPNHKHQRFRTYTELYKQPAKLQNCNHAYKTQWWCLIWKRAYRHRTSILITLISWTWNWKKSRTDCDADSR